MLVFGDPADNTILGVGHNARFEVNGRTYFTLAEYWETNKSGTNFSPSEVMLAGVLAKAEAVDAFRQALIETGDDELLSSQNRDPFLGKENGYGAAMMVARAVLTQLYDPDYRAPFKVGDREYKSILDYYRAQKAASSKPVVQRLLQGEGHPEAVTMATECEYVVSEWRSSRAAVLADAVKHSPLARVLAKTGKVLLRTSHIPHPYWGGQNGYGQALMAARAVLQQQHM